VPGLKLVISDGLVHNHALPASIKCGSTELATELM
jgi:hypothetical protein